MTNLFKNKKMTPRVVSIATLASLFLVLNASGALNTFWRTLDRVNPFSQPTNWNVCEYGYGYGSDGWGYGYGYGYGTWKTPCTPTTTTNSGTTTTPPGGGWGWGWSYYTTTKTTTNSGTTNTNSGTTTDKFKDIKVETSEDGKVTVTTKDGKKVTFSDINNTFAKEYIAKLAWLGIINGYEDGTFKPEQNASRAEYLKIVLRGMGIDYSNADTSKLTFADVDKDSWIAKVVVKAVELNMIDGANKNFRPNDNITRAESMKMLLNAAWIEVSETTTSDFSDVSGWAVKYVQKAKELWIVNGQEVNGKLIFRPFDSITRAEVAKIVVKTMELQ